MGVIDDDRRLIAAGKTYRWDVVKWAVTVNMGLAGASVVLKQNENAKGLFCLLAVGVVILSGLLLWEINRRMTKARNDSLKPLNFLIKPNYDKQELRMASRTNTRSSSQVQIASKTAARSCSQVGT